MEGKEIPVAVRIHHLDRRISRILEKKVREAGFDEVTLMHGWIIRYLYVNRDQAVFQKDIEKHCCVGRSTVTNVIQLMEKKGLIRRESVENDARLKKVLLTDKGYKHRAVVEGTLQQLNDALMKEISETDMEVFLRVLHQIERNMEEGAPGQPTG